MIDLKDAEDVADACEALSTRKGDIKSEAGEIIRALVAEMRRLRTELNNFTTQCGELNEEVVRLRGERDSFICALADCRGAAFDEQIDNPYLAGAVGNPLDVPAFVAYAFERASGERDIHTADAQRYRRLKSFADPSYNVRTVSNAHSASLAKEEFLTVHAGTWDAMDAVLDGIVTVNTVNIREQT